MTLSVENGTVTENIKYTDTGSVSFNGIKANDGFTVEGATIICDGGANGNISGETLTINNINYSQVCKVIMGKLPTIPKVTLSVTGGSGDGQTANVDESGKAKFTNLKTNYNFSVGECSCTNSAKCTYNVRDNSLEVSNVLNDSTCSLTLKRGAKVYYPKVSFDTPPVNYCHSFEIAEYGQSYKQHLLVKGDVSSISSSVGTLNLSDKNYYSSKGYTEGYAELSSSNMSRDCVKIGYCATASGESWLTCP